MFPSSSSACSAAGAGSRTRPSAWSPSAGCLSAPSAGASARPSSDSNPLSSGGPTVSSTSLPCACLPSAPAPRRPAPRACPRSALRAWPGGPPGPSWSVGPPPTGDLTSELRAPVPSDGCHSAAAPSRPDRRSRARSLPPLCCLGVEGPGTPPVGPEFDLSSVAILSMVLPKVLLNQSRKRISRRISRSSPQLDPTRSPPQVKRE